MTELTEQASFGIGEEGGTGRSCHHESVATAHHARAPSFLMRVLEIAVVAVIRFKSLQMASRERKCFSVSLAGGKSQTCIVDPSQLAGIIQGQIGHNWHPVVLELSVSKCTRAPGMMGDHWFKQKLPMRTDGNCPMPTDRRKKFFSIFEIRGRQYATVLRQPCHFATVKRKSVFRPSGWVGASKEEHRILHNVQRQVIPKDLKSKNDEVHIVKEVQVDMRN